MTEADIVNACGDILNESPDSYGLLLNSRFKTDAIRDCIRFASKQIVSVLLDSPNHWYRRSLVVKRSVTNGEAIKTLFEGGVEIDGKPGIAMPPGVVFRLKRNVNNRVSASGYYTVQGTIIHFTGSSCSIDEVAFDENISNINLPVGYTYAAATGALSLLFAHEGTNVAAAAHYGSLFNSQLQLIRQGATSIKAPTAYSPTT